MLFPSFGMPFPHLCFLKSSLLCQSLGLWETLNPFPCLRTETHQSPPATPSLLVVSSGVGC